MVCVCTSALFCPCFVYVLPTVTPLAPRFFSGMSTSSWEVGAYKKGDHLRPGNWRPICCAVTEAKLVWMVIFRRIQRRLYAAGVIPDIIWILDHKRCKIGPKTPQIFIVHPILMHILSYYM